MESVSQNIDKLGLLVCITGEYCHRIQTPSNASPKISPLPVSEFKNTIHKHIKFKLYPQISGFGLHAIFN